MPRRFQCNYSGELCDQRGCKRGRCVLEIQAREHDAQVCAARHALYEALPKAVRNECKRIAKQVYLIKGIERPTADQVQRLAATPRVMELAELFLSETYLA